jgi:glycerol-3-phosphate dehydrogenase (NAD(P)+)
MFGELFVKGEKFDKLAEGYYTAEAMISLGAKYGVELPICEAVYRILYENADCSETLSSLFSRSLKSEMWS